MIWDWPSFWAGVFASLTASYLLPLFRAVIDAVLSTFTTMFSPDSFRLSGTWVYRFTEPDPDQPAGTRQDEEKVRLKQVGNILWGSGETKWYKREFRYRLFIKHNVVSGTYKKVAEKGVAAGSGVVQLVVNADRNRMKGSMAWMDADTDQTESDRVIWQLIT